MGKRNRYYRKKNRISSFMLLMLCAFLWTTGCNGCSETSVAHEINDSDKDSDKNEENDANNKVTHFTGLEKVELPETFPSQIKEYEGFTVSFNKANKTPNYVAWELLGEEVRNDVQRTDVFWTDYEIEGCPDTRDYTRSGYDRGHMCPAADQKWSQQAMNDCFVMANICPQVNTLNAGAWNTLENKERQWAKRDSAIMIIAGPIYEKTDIKRIGNAGIRVPGAFFKVLLAPYAKEPRGIAFVYPNMNAAGNMQDYAMSIDELEKITGFDFFSTLPDNIENKVEKTYSFKEWNN